MDSRSTTGNKMTLGMNTVYDEIKPGFEKRLLLVTASVLLGLRIEELTFP